MVSKRSLLGLSLAASLCVPTLASAGSFGPEASALSLSPQPAAVAPVAQTSTATVESPLYLADAPAPAAPQIHGFLESPFKTAYITPRGLVVEDKGLVWQPVGGLIFPLPDVGIKDLSMVVGVWNSVNTHQGDPNVGAWNEMDVFVGFGGKITDQIKFDFDYEAWNFPNSTINKPKTEHNVQLKISFDDSKYWGKSGFSVNPYANFFYEIGGSSTVAFGKNGQTGYVELGIVPTYTTATSTPITIKVPTYFSVGPKEYWGRNDSAATKPDGNFGVFSAGVDVSVPLTFIPVQYGHWHASAGVLYYYLANDALLRAGGAVSGNTDRSKFNGYVSVGVGF